MIDVVVLRTTMATMAMVTLATMTLVTLVTLLETVEIVTMVAKIDWATMQVVWEGKRDQWRLGDLWV